MVNVSHKGMYFRQNQWRPSFEPGPMNYRRVKNCQVTDVLYLHEKMR